jgi:hypothetical protein
MGLDNASAKECSRQRSPEVIAAVEDPEPEGHAAAAAMLRSPAWRPPRLPFRRVSCRSAVVVATSSEVLRLRLVVQGVRTQDA